MRLGLARKISLGLFLPAALAGCNDGTGGGTHAVTLKFAAVVGDLAAKCGQVYTGLGTTSADAEILDLRLYVSRIRLVNTDGQEVPLMLDQDGKWQVDDVALLDFEAGTGKCADSGTADVRGEVTGTVPEGSYQGVVFDVGIPFALNHSDLTAAPPPLNVSTLFWSWAAGHQFIHIDLEINGAQQWSAHLGSTMCVSGGPAEPPVTECDHPNRPRISLGSFDPVEDTIELDLARLFAGSELSQDTPDSASGCQSFPDDANECTPLFPSLGIDFATGQCINGCTNQTAFRIRHGSDSATEAAIARGEAAFATPHRTAGGESLACADCHGNDGTGAVGPDIREGAASHLIEHSQADGPHPDGVKFASVTAADYDDIAAYLASICRKDPNCMPGSVGDHEDDHEHEE